MAPLTKKEAWNISLSNKCKKKKKKTVVSHSNQYRNKLNNDIWKIHKNKRMNVLRKLCFDEKEITF